MKSSKIGFIAVGQAGGNIGQLFEEKGYQVLYINTSNEDLDTLKDAVHKYHIPSGEGCNKDRNKAKQLVFDDYDNIAVKIEETMSCDIIYVIFASGGGTGSGTGPMLVELLLQDNNSVGVITILPSQEESIKSQYNSYECFSELVKINNIASCFILDNDKEDRMNINSIFVNAFDAFIHVPELYKSDKGNIDNAEVMESLKAPGMAILQGYSDTVLSKIVDSINDNIFAPIEQDRKIKYITGALPENIKDFSEIVKATGTPIDEFRAYTDNKAVLLLSGLSYPAERLDVIHSFIQDNKDVILKNTAPTQGIDMKLDIDFFGSQSAVAEPKKDNPKSHRDILNMYLRK